MLLPLNKRVAAQIRPDHLVLLSWRVVCAGFRGLSHARHSLLLAGLDACTLDMVSWLMLICLHLGLTNYSPNALALLPVNRGVFASCGCLADRIDLSHLDHRSFHVFMLGYLLVLHSPVRVVPLILQGLALTLVIRLIDGHLLHFGILNGLSSCKHHWIHVVNVHLLELGGLELVFDRLSRLADELLLLALLVLLEALESA